jgi:hypothetical protein
MQQRVARDPLRGSVARCSVRLRSSSVASFLRVNSVSSVSSVRFMTVIRKSREKIAGA